MSETKRPVLKIPQSFVERLLQGISAGALAANAIILIMKWNSFPGKIPSHFGVSGEADAWSGKGTLVSLPVTCLVLYALITLLERYPHIFNYVVEITEQNAEYQYRNARCMMIWLKTELILVFSYIEWIMIQTALQKANGLGNSFLPVYLVVLLVTMGYFISRMFKNK